MNCSALLQNLLQCENEESPIIRCNSKNINLVLDILEQTFYMGGFPIIQVNFDKDDKMDKIKRKKIVNLCSIL